VVATCSLETVFNRPIGQLSKGFRQRVGLAQALIHDPDILILDEPTSGLDPTQIRDMRNLIRELGDHSSVILSTHQMHEVESICDRAIILQDGNLIFSGSIAELRRQSDVESSFIRLNAMQPNGSMAK